MSSCGASWWRERYHSMIMSYNTLSTLMVLVRGGRLCCFLLLCFIVLATVRHDGGVKTILAPHNNYRRILGVRYLSNRLTSGYAANTNKTYGGKSSYAMYFMPYIVDSVVGFINDENMAPRDVSAPNGAQ